MPKIPPVSPRKLIKILERAGFRVARQRASHVILVSERGVRIVVPVHPGREVKPTLVRAIIREAGLSREEFFKLLEEV